MIGDVETPVVATYKWQSKQLVYSLLFAFRPLFGFMHILLKEGESF